MARGSDNEGLARAHAKEMNTYRAAKSGTGTHKLAGPNRSVAHNPTNSGGINRATKGTGAGKRSY